MPSSTRYHVYYAHDGYWDYAGGFWIRLGDLNPNGTLVAELPASDPGGADPYWYLFELTGIPGNCSVSDPNPSTPLFEYTIRPGDTLEVEFTVACKP
jgi:hypothetical protein